MRRDQGDRNGQVLLRGKKIKQKTNRECFVLFLLVFLFLFLLVGKEGNYFKAGWCDNTHNKTNNTNNAQTCIFSYNKDLQTEVF